MKELFEIILSEINESGEKTSIDTAISLAKLLPTIIELSKTCDVKPEETKTVLGKVVREWIIENKETLLFDVSENLTDAIVEQIAENSSLVVSS